MNKHNLTRFHGKYRKNAESGCWDWTARKNEHGYGVFVTGHSKASLAHRAIYDHVFGIPVGKSVLHSCDNRACVNPAHLRAGTQAENVQDMMDRKRRVAPTPQHGESNPMAKLSGEQVAAIRKAYRPRVVTLKILSAKYGVSQGALSLIINRKRW